MINLGMLLEGGGIPVVTGINFYQGTIRDIMSAGEQNYWSLLKVWDLTAREMVPSNLEGLDEMSDFEVWRTYVLSVPEFQKQVQLSARLFFHTKIEFLPIINTIMIGENDSLRELDASFYYTAQMIVRSMTDYVLDKKENDQYKETETMSERERQIIAKMKKSAETLDRIKNGEQDNKDRLVKQVVSLVAIGKYTFQEVYDMTIIQMMLLLKKYVDIQQYELITALSPYMDSKKGQGVKHWLDT